MDSQLFRCVTIEGFSDAERLACLVAQQDTTGELDLLERVVHELWLFL